MTEHDAVSPELALIDPELRARALEELSRTEATRMWAPYAPVRLHKPQIEALAPARRTSLPVAVSVYFVSATAHVALWGIVLMVALALAIAAVVLLT
jgi:hypothetical protein